MQHNSLRFQKFSKQQNQSSEVKLKAPTTFVSFGSFDFTTPAQNANKISKF